MLKRRFSRPETNGKEVAVMFSCKFLIVPILFILTPCFGQDRGGVDPGVALPIVRNVLGTAQVSGSLEYWGRCDFQRSYPDFPKIRMLSDYSGSPQEVLQQVFAPDPQMRVTRDAQGGKIRMVETDVPSDLLDVKIQYISFNLKGPGAKIFTGPNIALQIILGSPEVRAFRSEHDIGPFDDGFGWPGSSGPNKAAVSGELHDVTLSQALDYVLETFPGFWVYENCRNNKGDRTVFFGFFETFQSRLPQQ